MSSKTTQWTFAFGMFVAIALVPLAVLAQAPSAHRSTLTPGPPPPPTSVLVTNTTSQPVPTVAQGTTTVGGTINVGNTPAVTVANTPSVNVANTPTVTLGAGSSVNVTNASDPNNNPVPLLVTEARNRWEDTCYVQFSGVTGGCLFRAVPANTVLVIREFDAFGGVETGLRPVSLTVETTVSHYFPATLMAVNAGGYDYLATHQETYIYVNQNNQPGCDITLSGASSVGSYHCSISGYLVPLF